MFLLDNFLRFLSNYELIKRTIIIISVIPKCGFNLKQNRTVLLQINQQ